MFQTTQSPELTASNRLARLIRSRQLLKRYQEHEVALMWFTDDQDRNRPIVWSLCVENVEFALRQQLLGLILCG